MWSIQVCDRCGWTAHTPQPRPSCPNGCGAPVSADATVGAVGMASAVSRLARRLGRVAVVVNKR